MSAILRRYYGFSLIELIVWIAVAGILIAGVTMLVGRSFSVSRFQVEQARITDEARLHSERMAEDIRQAQYADCNGDGDTEDTEDTWLRQASPTLISFLTDHDNDGEIEKVTYELVNGELYRTVAEMDTGSASACVFTAGEAQKMTGFLVNEANDPLFQFFPLGSADSVGALVVDPNTGQLTSTDRQQTARVSINILVDVNPNQDPPAGQVGTDVTPRVGRRGVATTPSDNDPPLVLPSVPPPKTCSINPNSGVVGDSLTITTSSLNLRKAIFYPNKEVVVSRVGGVWRAQVPAGTQTGKVFLKEQDDNLIECPEFTIKEAVPAVECLLAPSAGSAGDEVRIYGSKITGVNKVTFYDGQNATWTNDTGNSNSVLATVPQCAQTGSVLVDTASNGTVTCPEFSTMLLNVKEKPMVVYVIDNSGSTSNSFRGSYNVGDLNSDYNSNTVLDAEIAAFIALNKSLVSAGWGSDGRAAVVEFESSARVVKGFTAPGQDSDGNGLTDVEDSLRSIRISGGTNYDDGLIKTENLLVGSLTDDFGGHVVFLSDGYPNNGNGSYIQTAQRLRVLTGGSVHAIGVGGGSSLQYLQRIDPNARQVMSPEELIGLFTGGRKDGCTGGSVPVNLTCTPGTGPVSVSLKINQKLTLTVASTSMNYGWFSPGGTPSGSPDCPATYTTQYGAEGVYVVSAGECAGLGTIGKCADVTVTDVAASPSPSLSPSPLPSPSPQNVVHSVDCVYGSNTTQLSINRYEGVKLIAADGDQYTYTFNADTGTPAGAVFKKEFTTFFNYYGSSQEVRMSRTYDGVTYYPPWACVDVTVN